jgi:hypothetical protein
MPDERQSIDGGPLQFDRAVSVSASPGRMATPAVTHVTCAGCRSTIDTEYFQINGNIVCGRCRTAIEAAAETPRGIGSMMVAGLFGAGAGIAGAAIYYAVIAIAHLEIGIVAILIGYMVGYSVRKGARGRGGVRFQILAATLTYASVALAYTPIAVSQVTSRTRTAQTRSAATPTVEPQRVTTASPSAATLLLSFGVVTGFIVVLPVLVVVGSLPFGLISAFIIFIGMKQAWRMTAAPMLDVLGPYRVGALAVAGSA